MSLVTYELEDHIATITLNRPEARNAINCALRQDLNAAWDRFRDEEDAWVGILTANGSVFCAGADLNDGEGSVGTFGGTFWEKPTNHCWADNILLCQLTGKDTVPQTIWCTDNSRRLVVDMHLNSSKVDLRSIRPAWFVDFLVDRATRKPSEHTMKAYRQDFTAVADLLTAGRPGDIGLTDITKGDACRVRRLRVGARACLHLAVLVDLECVV